MLRGGLCRLLLVAIAGAPAPLIAAELQIVNSSGKPIEELYLAPAGQRTWGNDWLRRKPSGVIAGGESHTLADVAPGSYQLMMVVDGSECQIDFLDIAADQRIDLTPRRLRECTTSH
jgi:hypothetical protein